MSKKKSKEKVVEFSKLTNKVAAVWTRVSTERQADTNVQKLKVNYTVK